LFCIDVTFEMKSMRFTQMHLFNWSSDTKSNCLLYQTEEGAKDKIAERATEREQELGCSGYSIGCKMDRYIIHMFAKQDCQHLERLLLISKMRNLANEVSHNRSVLTAKIFGATTTQHFLTIEWIWDFLNIAKTAWNEPWTAFLI
jgi:hypothetical protein